MNEDCLIKIKPLVSDLQYKNLAAASQTKNPSKWGQALDDVMEDFAVSEKQGLMNADIEGSLIAGIKDHLQTDPKLVALRAKEVKAKGKKALKIKKQIRARRKSLANQTMDAMWDDSGFTSSKVTSTYKEELAMTGILSAQLHNAINKNEGAYGRSVRLMNEQHSRDLANAIITGKRVNTVGANEIAKAVAEADDYGIRLMQAAGSRIYKREKYGLGNTYDPVKLLEGTEDEFVAYHMVEGRFEFFDNPDIKNPKYLPSQEPERLLRDMYKNITEGFNDAIDGVTIEYRGQPSMANRKQAFRYLQATDGDVWFNHAQKYGKVTDPLQMVKVGIQEKAHQIVMLEKWGTDPTTMWRNYRAAWQDIVEDDGVGEHANNMFINMTAAFTDPEDKVIQISQGIRGLFSSMYLGSATLSAMTDTAFMVNEAIFTGISPARVVARHMKGLVSSKQLKIAQELGIISHHVLQVVGNEHRLADITGNGATNRMVNFMLTASGLNRWTEAGKAAFGLEFLNAIARTVEGGKPNAKLVAVFERYGISMDEIAMLKNFVVERDGLRLLDVTRLSQEAGTLNRRILAMTRELTQSAVPEPGMSVITRMAAGTKRGTRGNEALKILTQFLTFPATTMIRGVQRLTDASIPLGSRIGHAVGTAVGASLLGGIVIQGKQLTKGNAMYEWDDPKFWARGATQGATFGFLTDMVFSQDALFGPPTLREVDRMRKFMTEPFTSKEDFLDAAVTWAKELAPSALYTAEKATGFATNLWYTKLIWDRTISQFMHRAIAPNKYDEDVKNYKTYLKRTNPGNEPVWQKGEYLPEFLQ